MSRCRSDAGFTPADDRRLAEPEAVISDRVWEVRFNSDPDIIGRTVTINQTGHTIVGVAPEGFRGHLTGLDEGHHQLWLPLARHPRLTATPAARLERESGWVHVAGRLDPTTMVAEAGASDRGDASGVGQRGCRRAASTKSPSSST